MNLRPLMVGAAIGVGALVGAVLQLFLAGWVLPQ